jgi:hypothetical protein
LSLLPTVRRELTLLSAAYGRLGPQRERGKAKSRYEKAIAELEAAREALNNEATLLNWLSSGDIAEAATDALGGRCGSDPDARPVLAFTRTLEELRRDCEHGPAILGPLATRSQSHGVSSCGGG